MLFVAPPNDSFILNSSVSPAGREGHQIETSDFLEIQLLLIFDRRVGRGGGYFCSSKLLW